MSFGVIENSFAIRGSELVVPVRIEEGEIVMLIVNIKSPDLMAIIITSLYPELSNKENEIAKQIKDAMG